jgi:hypothetical protein
VDRLLHVLEAADVVEGRRPARLELDRRSSAVRPLVPSDLHHALQAEGGVELPPQRADALDDPGRLRGVCQLAGEGEVALPRRQVPRRDEALRGQRILCVERAVLVHRLGLMPFLHQRLGE